MSGTLLIDIKIGKIRIVAQENRLSLFFNNDYIEDEFHFVIQCEFHNYPRSMFEKLS